PLQLSTSADVQAGAVTPGGRAVIADQDLTNQTYDVAYFDGTQVKRLSDIFDTSELWLTGSAPMINDNDAGIVIVQGHMGPSFVATILAWDTLNDAYSIIVQAGQMISVSD